MITFKKILIIDDDFVCNYLTQEIIISLNLAEGVAVATNGEEALQYFNEKKTEDFEYGLILLDLKMPVMDGFELLDKINQEFQILRKNIKIVVLTSSSSGVDIEKLRRKRIDGFIVKPLTAKNLIDIVKML